MNEALILRLAELFAIIAAKTRMARDFRKTFVQFAEQYDLDDEHAAPYLLHFDQLLKQISTDDALLTDANADDAPFFCEKLAQIALRINSEFERQQKTWLVLQCLEFVGEIGADPSITLFVQELAEGIQIDKKEYANLCHFVLSDEQHLPFGSHLLLIARHNHCADGQAHFLPNEKLQGRIYVLYEQSAVTMLIRYFGQRALFFNGRILRVGRVYVFGVGGVIRNPHISPVYYNDVLNIFIQKNETPAIHYSARSVSYRFRRSKNGVHPFSFQAKEGDLVAVMGGSGAGKSTLLNLLSGQLKPRTGSICINGHDIRTEKDNVESVVGYVPQDDLLIEELSVYDNLYYNALLCFKDYAERQIHAEVSKTLEQFDLAEAAHLKVGNPLNKFISGGQRKRLNIAMELMRQPSALFIDEPTSGLSSVDSEKIMLILKRLSLQGKIIIVNIHQPSSDIYKLFNIVIILDQGGHIIFQGNPMDAIVYFKEAAHYLNADESECSACGHINTELILRVVEERAVNEYGRHTPRRKHSPAEWYGRYLARVQAHLPKTPRPPLPLPPSSFRKPSRLRQMQIFFRRNLKAKLANKQYLLITLLGAPLLALILGYFTRFSAGAPNNPAAYVFADNANIPSYLFISVIAVFFFGLSASAQEIIKDRKALQRERLLHLSRRAYLLSKVAWLCIISGFQTLSFVLIGNAIQEIYGLTLQYCAVLFSVSVCGGMIGLNLSAGLNSDASIYIFIPLILIPQILFSGVVIEYEQLHRRRSSADGVPFAADITPARWAYEALAVTQFRDNRYQKQFVQYDEALSRLSYASNLLIPQIEIAAATAERDLLAGIRDPYALSRLALIQNELPALHSCAAKHDIPFPFNSLYHSLTLLISNPDSASARHFVFIREKLDTLRLRLQARYRLVAEQKDNHTKRLIGQLGGGDALLSLQKRYHNKALADMLLCKSEMDKIREVGGHLLQIRDPVFKEAGSRWGRAHFYASRKRVGSVSVGVLWFNIAALWAMNALLYLVLRLDLLRRAVQQINRIKLRRIARRTAVV